MKPKPRPPASPLPSAPLPAEAAARAQPAASATASHSALPPSPAPAALASRSVIAVGALLLAVAVTAAYARSFKIPFFFDDVPGIVENTSIREWWRLDQVLAPPANGSSVTGRPLVNLSLALNYALGGLNPAGYHVVNLLLHLAGTLALFGIVRRTWLMPGAAPRDPALATPVGFAAALLWGLHPLQTESVLCVIQRTEVLVGTLYLFTLYAFVRSTQEARAGLWRGLAIAGALLGVTAKEVMATAPVLVLLFDRTFVAGSFSAAWRARRGFYLGLLSSWVLLGVLVVAMGGGRGEVAGFGLGVTAWSYLLKQCEALILYLRLSVWPHPLVIDYGIDVVEHLSTVLPQALAVVTLLALTFYAAWRRPWLGFLGLWFFLILAPSSSFIPLISQTMTEHRMYLPLAAVVALFAAGCAHWGGKKGLVGALAAAVALGVVTYRRSLDYLDEGALWRLTIAQRPENPRPYNHLGDVCYRSARYAEAAQLYLRALTLRPLQPEAMSSLAGAYIETPPTPATIAALQTVLRLRPEFATLVGPLPDPATVTGRKSDTIPLLRLALQLRPHLPAAYINLALALADAGRYDDAAAASLQAFQLNPTNPASQRALAHILLTAGQLAPAQRVLEAVIARHPGDAGLHAQLGGVLYRLGQPAAAIPHFEAMLRADPASTDAHNNLASALSQLGRNDEAIAHYREALRLAPDAVDPRLNLGLVLSRAGRTPEAIAEFETILRAQPNHGMAHFHLGYALFAAGRRAEAVAHFETAVRLLPGFAPAGAALREAQAANAR